MSSFLGEYNTNENLDSWMNYFKGKIMKKPWWIIIPIAVSLTSQHVSGGYLAAVIFIFGLMAFNLLFQILTTLKMPKVNGEAAKILSELLYSRIEKEGAPK